MGWRRAMRFWGVAGLLCGLALPAAAQDGPGTISTHASAHAQLPNTVADVTVGVVAQAPTVAAVQAAMTDGSNRLLGFLRGRAVERLRTEQVSVRPEMQIVHGQPDRIAGYEGTVVVGFRVAAERVGETVSGALENGGNTVQGTVLRPREAEVEAARRRLASDAVRTALAEAGAVAEAAGRKLGPVRQIRVDPAPEAPQPPVNFGAVRAAAMNAPALGTEAGESEVVATVSMTVGLVEP